MPDPQLHRKLLTFKCGGPDRTMPRQQLLSEDEVEGPVDGSYKRALRLLKAYVDERGGPAVHPVDGLRHYITREYVDGYFMHVVPTFTIQPSGVSRHRSGLQFWADEMEWREEDGYERFIVDSRIVQKAIDRYGSNYLADFQQQNRDIHANIPTNVLTDEDHREAMKHLFNSRHSFWRDFAISWTVCQATFIRQDSLRKLTLPCLRADKGHGPPGIIGPNATILSLILPPGVNKEDSQKNAANKQTVEVSRKRAKIPTNYRSKVVGMYRHQNVLQCATGFIGISLITRFHTQHTLQFTADTVAGADGAGLWQQHGILQSWNNVQTGGKSTEDAYRCIMNECSISWNKVTHLRSSGMERASTRGLNADEVATMSKHKKERIFESYMTELYPSVMQVMAGFRKEESYFVPRIEVELPCELQYLIRYCFPAYDNWLSDWNEGQGSGDRHASTRNFLTELIPFISRVIVQDLPWWLKYFPNHPYSIFVRQKFPIEIWRDWAPQAIIKAREIANSRATRSMEVFNRSVQ